MANLHEQSVFQLNKVLKKNEKLPDWLTYRQKLLCQKDRAKGNAVENC